MSNVIELSDHKAAADAAEIGRSYIDITPTWSSMMPAMIAVLMNPNADPEAHQMVADELLRLAVIVDQTNEEGTDK